MGKCIELGKFEAIRNGKTLKYRIRTVTPELIEDILNFMVTYFLPREPMSSYLKIYEDPIAVQNIRDLWRKALQTGTPLVALEETGDGSVNIIGANITTIVKKNKDELKENNIEEFNQILGILQAVLEDGKIFEKYNIDKYLSAYGLTVHPDYHGYNIGAKLLECRKPLCEELGLTATGTVFTAKGSQYIAEKVGFQLLAQLEYKTYKFNGKSVFSNLEGDVKFMGIKYR